MTSDLRVSKVLGASHRYVDALTYATASIARGVRTLRRRAGLTQATVARRAGIRVETLSRLENGRSNPTVATVRRIVRAIQRGAKPLGSAVQR